MGGRLRTMDIIDGSLRLIGAFYAFAGYAATRAALTSLLVDRAIAAIGGKNLSRVEAAQSFWLLAAATLILIGGVALALLLHFSVWLFLASAAGQALYLFGLAPRIFDLEDPPPAAGRRQSQNAFAIYLIATAVVLWAASRGRLLPWHEVPAPLLAVAALGVAGHLAYVLWSVIGVSRMSRGSAAPLFAEPPDADELCEPGRDPSQSRAIKVMADYHAHPLWAMDDDLYGDFPPERLGLSAELIRDLSAWADAFTSSIDADDPARRTWSDAQRKEHIREGRALAIRLARERPDLKVYVEDGENGVVEVNGREEA